MFPDIYSPGLTWYVVWQKGNETDFLLTMNFILFLQIKVTPFKVVPLGKYTATEALFPLFVAVLEGFQLVGYARLHIIQSTKMAHLQVVLSGGNKEKSQGLRTGEWEVLKNQRNAFFLPKFVDENCRVTWGVVVVQHPSACNA